MKYSFERHTFCVSYLLSFIVLLCKKSLWCGFFPSSNSFLMCFQKTSNVKVNKKKKIYLIKENLIFVLLVLFLLKNIKKSSTKRRINKKKNKSLPGSWYFKFLAKCVNCNGIYLVSALGGLRGAGGVDVAPGPSGHKKALCNSQPTSDIILALRKYGVTSRRNLTEINKKEKKI